MFKIILNYFLLFILKLLKLKKWSIFKLQFLPVASLHFEGKNDITQFLIGQQTLQYFLKQQDLIGHACFYKYKLML